MNALTMLDVEIERLYDKLADLEPDSKEYEAVNKNLATLMGERIEIEKLEVSEAHNKEMESIEIEKIKMSEAHNEKQMIEERNARWIKNAIDVALGVGSIALTVWGAKASFKFEEEGTLSTQTGKKLFDRIFRK